MKGRFYFYEFDWFLWVQIRDGEVRAMSHYNPFHVQLYMLLWYNLCLNERHVFIIASDVPLCVS